MSSQQKSVIDIFGLKYCFQKYFTIDVKSYLHCRNAPLGYDCVGLAYWTEEGLSWTYVTSG